MNKDELLEAVLKFMRESGIDPTASRIDGQYVIGIETEAGEYFIEIQDA